MSDWVTVAKVTEIPPERVGVYTVGDHEVAVCNVNGEFFAIDDLCTHDGGALDQGELEGDEIECPRHGARFDVRSGRATQLPAFEPVETHDVRVEGDDIQVGVEHPVTTTDDLSREIILDHYQNPRNHGRIEQPTLANRGHNPLCGDEIELFIDIDSDEERIANIAFTGRGCSISQASASMMTEAVKGHRLDEAEEAASSFSRRMADRQPPPPEIEEELDALQGVKKYPARVKCALLPWTTLRETVDLYRHREPTSGPAEDCADAP